MIKKVLIIAFNEKWTGISRLPSGLDRAGFEVYALCPAQSYLASTRFLKDSILFPTFTYARSKLIYLWMIAAIFIFKPDLIIPGDEDAILALQNLSNRLLKVSFLKIIPKVIRKSMTAQAFDFVMLAKSDFQKKCNEWKLRTPMNFVVDNLASALIAASRLHYPLVIKMDAGYGGHGVFICYDHKDLENYFQGLFKTTIVFKIKKFIKNLFFVSIFSSNCKISLQQFIKGTEGQAPFCANEGHVFGQNAMKRVRTLTSTTGPSTVIEGIVNPEIENYVKIVANELKYTGFGSLEFIIEEKSGLPYVIEFNPRPTPTCHISNSIMPNDLCRLFFRGLNNLPIKLGEFMPYTLAMYPGELLRDPQSSFLREAYHDIPTDDLALLKTLGNSIKP